MLDEEKQRSTEWFSSSHNMELWADLLLSVMIYFVSSL